MSLANGEGISNSKSGATRKAKMSVKQDFQSKAKSIVSGRTETFSKNWYGASADSVLMTKFEECSTSIMEGAVEGWVEIKSTTVVEKSVRSKWNAINHVSTLYIGGN